MQRGFRFNQRQQCYGDEGIWIETQAQQQSYAFHDESWTSNHSNYHKQFPSMHMHMHMNNNRLGAFGYTHHGGATKFPSAGNNPSYHFSKIGGKFSSGGNHEYFSEESEYEEAYTEEHVVGAITAKVDEMRYQQYHNLGGYTCYVSPYDKNKIKNMNHKHHKVECTSKGV